MTARATRIERLISAVEGECDGLAITEAQAQAILSFVDHGLLTSSGRSARECSAAFEWLRAEATKDGASPHAGVVLDEWHALTTAITPNVM